MSETLKVGVIGVGTMGEHHTRVYKEISGGELVGIADKDIDRAAEIAGEYGTDVYSTGELIERANAVSIVTPTAAHYNLALSCIEAGTDILIEKPFVETKEQGEHLINRAKTEDVTLQVGHIERFNPVTDTLRDILPGLDVISVSSERLGPEPDRPVQDTAVVDLMIHDIDVITSLIDDSVTDIQATGNADGRHAMAALEFENGVVASLAASRVTQRKIRRLTITAESCYVDVDYLDQSIEIHRQSSPEYIADNGDIRYRHESIVENPAVENTEPLKKELRSFVDAARNSEEPRVTGEDGIRSLMITKKINEKAFGVPDKQVGVVSK